MDGLKRHRMGKTLKARAAALVVTLLVAGLAACGAVPDDAERGGTDGVTISLAGGPLLRDRNSRCLRKRMRKPIHWCISS